MDRDIVLFLGAGFSADADLPVMSRFAEDARIEKFDISKYADADPPQRLMAPDLKKAATIYESFRKSCQCTKALSPKKSGNIEKVFCVAEALKATGHRNVILERKQYPIDEVIASIELWVWKIYHQLPFFNITKRSPNPKTYHNFFDIFKRSGLVSRTSIVTTNYDIVFEWMAYESGLRAHYPIKYQLANVGTGTEQFIARSATLDTVPVYKLHGSSNFFRTSRKINTLYVSGNISDGRAIGKTRLLQGRPSVTALDALAVLRLDLRDDRLQPVIVPPTYSKAVRATWQKEVWGGAMAALKRCRAAVFIGYSLPPTDGFMESALAASLLTRKVCKKPQVFVINDKQKVHRRFRQIYGRNVVQSTPALRLDEANSELLPQVFRQIASEAAAALSKR